MRALIFAAALALPVAAEAATVTYLYEPDGPLSCITYSCGGDFD